MDINYTNLTIFLIVLSILLVTYYRYGLKAEEGEDKRIKMIKRILVFVILTGILHIYSITEDVKLKEFFVVIIAVLVNIYTVVHSTRRCNYPQLYVIQLSLFSSFVTIMIALSIWYVTNNSLFGFVLNKSVEKKVEDVKSTFTTTLLTGGTDVARVDCPDPTHEDYNSQMADLQDKNLPKYNACLSQEVRDDLKKGI